MTNTVMPDMLNLGQNFQTPIYGLMHRYETWKESGSPDDPFGRRMVMGFALPVWQRPLVWDMERKVRFLESAWLGLGLGTYTYNVARMGSPYDEILIDGQQRLWAIQCYLENEFSVFGYRYAEITDVDRRLFGMSRIFSSYITKSEDENYLREYYDLMNFGGVAHTEDQRASR